MICRICDETVPGSDVGAHRETCRRLRIYLCGPMTVSKAADNNRSAFMDAAHDLEARGHTVFNPGNDPVEMTYEQAMRLDIETLLTAEAVVTLPGWIEGVGTRVEVAVALAIGTPVYEYTPAGLVKTEATGRNAVRDLLNLGGAE